MQFNFKFNLHLLYMATSVVVLKNSSYVVENNLNMQITPYFKDIRLLLFRLILYT